MFMCHSKNVLYYLLLILDPNMRMDGFSIDKCVGIYEGRLFVTYSVASIT